MSGYKSTVSEVKSLYSKGIKFGTDTTRKLLDKLSRPDEKFKIIHISGTNGKGSVAEFITQILLSAGKTVGTFTSPEVFEYRDMFRVNGEPLSESLLQTYLNKALAAAEGAATGFEVETAAAIYAFAEQNCEYAVLECGMGGTYDATNAVSKKEVAAITSISLEHTSFLGSTVSEICAHKAGIIKNCPAVVSTWQTDEAKEYFKKTGVKIADNVTPCDGGFIYGGKQYTLSAQGCLQPYNAAVAIECARVLGIDENAIYAGVSKTVPLGRLQIFNLNDLTVILDGAHNPAAMVPISEYLKGINARKTLIFGCLSDKDICGVLDNLKGCADEVFCVECKSARAAPLNIMQSACRRRFSRVQTFQNVTEALNSVTNKVAAVCGSFTLLSEAKQWINKKQKKQ